MIIFYVKFDFPGPLADYVLSTWKNSLTNSDMAMISLILSFTFKNSHQFRCGQERWCSIKKVRGFFIVSVTHFGNFG